MLIADREICKFPSSLGKGPRAKGVFSTSNPARQPLADRRQKAVELIFGAFDHQFNSPVSQIAYIAGHLEATSQRTGRIAKANSLDIARVNDLPTLKR